MPMRTGRENRWPAEFRVCGIGSETLVDLLNRMVAQQNFQVESCKTRPVAHQDDAGFEQIGSKNHPSSLVCLAITTPPDLLNPEIATIVSNATTEASGGCLSYHGKTLNT